MKKRTVYDTYDEALNMDDTFYYPIDGIIVMTKEIRHQLKLKTIKTIELKYMSGSMFSHDMVEIAHLREDVNLDNNDILEISFHYDKKRQFDIVDVCVRPDKSKINESKAIYSIIMSFDNDQYLSNMIKGAITDVCFTIRRMVYSRALSKRTRNRIYQNYTYCEN